MNWFKNVSLISSYQDHYAPFDSARIEVCKDALSDNVYQNIKKNLFF